MTKTGKIHIVYCSCILVLVAILAMLCSNDRSAEVIERYTTDTLVVYKTDTIVEHHIQWREKRIVDTLIVATNGDDSIALPIVQKHYNSPQRYDLWISGVEPLNVDTMMVYDKVEYRIITNETVREIYPKRTEIYVFGGFNAIDGTLSPKVGISIKTKNKWLISPEIGLYDKKAFYGVTIGKKLF